MADYRDTGLELTVYDRGGAHHDVRAYGVEQDGATSYVAEMQALIDLAPPKVVLGEGELYVAAGQQIELRSDLTIEGRGRQQTVVSSHNAYAFTAPTAGCDRVQIRGISFQLRAGSTSGGAVKARSSGYQSGWMLEELYGDGDVDSPDPVFDLDGFIGSYADNIQAQTCQTGIRLGDTGFVTNAAALTRFRVSAATVAGLLFDGGGMQRARDGIIENCTGVGFKNDGCVLAVLDSVWFENNGASGQSNRPDVLITGAASGTKIRDCKFHYHVGGTSPHIQLTGPTSPAALYAAVIEGNHFVDASGDGYDVRINADCAGTLLALNQWHGTAPYYEDLGTGTQLFGNKLNDALPTPNRIGGPWEAAYDPYYNNQNPTFWGKRRASQTSDLLLLEDESGTDLARVNPYGRGMFTAQSVQIAVKAGVPSDGDVTGGVADGIAWLDSTNNRIYFRVNGAWKYATLT